MFWLLPLPLDEPIFRFCSFLPEVARATSNRVLLCLFFATHQTYVCTRAPARGCLECPWPNTHTHNFYSTKYGSRLLGLVQHPLSRICWTLFAPPPNIHKVCTCTRTGGKNTSFEHKFAVQSLRIPTHPLPNYSDTVRPTSQHPANLHMRPDPAWGGGLGRGAT